jgi:hypothetical protein
MKIWWQLDFQMAGDGICFSFSIEDVRWWDGRQEFQRPFRARECRSIEPGMLSPAAMGIVKGAKV